MDLTIKGIPEGITEAQVKEWCGVLIERYENQKVNQIEAVKTATEAARNNIDAFRKANALIPKFEKVEEVKES